MVIRHVPVSYTHLAGVSIIASSDDNIAEIKKVMTAQTIGYDKINQLRHVQFFKNADGVRKHMQILADCLKPKFETVLNKMCIRDRDQAVPLEKDEYFIADLIGLSVIREDNGEVLGELTDVLQTGANDVYEVKMEDGKEVLLPAIRECIKNVDLQKGEITVHVMKGLLDE